MNVPFRFRKIPLYTFDHDGRFDKARIIGRDKRGFRKRQMRRFWKSVEPLE